MVNELKEIKNKKKIFSFLAAGFCARCSSLFWKTLHMWPNVNDQVPLIPDQENTPCSGAFYP